MAIYVNTNIPSLDAQRHLTQSSYALKKTLQRLSSGLRINSAADDPAGLAIAQTLTAQIRGSEQGIRNANEGVTLAQTSGSALSQIQGDLQTIRQLALQATNGTMTDTNRSQLQLQVDQLTQEISRIVQTTNFNGTLLLSGGPNLTFQVGPSGISSHQVVANGLNLSSGLNSYAVNLTATGTINITTSANASAVLSTLDADINTISNDYAQVGAIQNRFQSVVSNLQNNVQNLSDARSRLVDADFAAEITQLAQKEILLHAGTAVLMQANLLPRVVLSLLKVD